MRFLIAILALLVLLPFGDAKALNAKLLEALIQKLATNSEKAGKHADEVIEKAGPSTRLPNAGSVHASPDGSDWSRSVSNALRNGAQNKQCPISDQTFPARNELLIVTGEGVNIRSCTSTSCPILMSVNKGAYDVNVLSSSDCWIAFEIVEQTAPKQTLYISGQYARVAAE